VGLRRNS
jgi:hypothetical protein